MAKRVAKKPKSTVVKEVEEVVTVSSRGRQLQYSKRLRELAN